jgi:hypothetical protein
VPGSISIGLMSACGLLGMVCLAAIGCRSTQAQAPPSIEFTRLPPAGPGSPDTLNPIEGRITGAQPGQRVVLFARSGVWWVQPLAETPFTTIQPDSHWKSSTHPGSAYAALLVEAGYKPPPTVNALPQKGGPVLAVATAEGAALVQPPLSRLHFSGYEWTVRQIPGNPGGSRNLYDVSNASVDQKGFLHLRIARGPAGWTSAEVYLPRSLGYGSYRFTISDISQLDPALTFTVSTWDDTGPSREMDIEISRWGESSGKNAQFVVQPYYIPANVVRFLAPAGRLTWSFDWEPGRVSFRAARGSPSAAASGVVFGHVFTSGVPSPGSEAVHLNFYISDTRHIALQHPVEVILEKFEYLP